MDHSYKVEMWYVYAAYHSLIKVLTLSALITHKMNIYYQGMRVCETEINCRGQGQGSNRAMVLTMGAALAPVAGSVENRQAKGEGRCFAQKEVQRMRSWVCVFLIPLCLNQIH